jgi:hypothetical protein
LCLPHADRPHYARTPTRKEVNAALAPSALRTLDLAGANLNCVTYSLEDQRMMIRIDFIYMDNTGARATNFAF